MRGVKTPIGQNPPKSSPIHSNCLERGLTEQGLMGVISRACFEDQMTTLRQLSTKEGPIQSCMFCAGCLYTRKKHTSGVCIYDLMLHMPSTSEQKGDLIDLSRPNGVWENIHTPLMASVASSKPLRRIQLARTVNRLNNGGIFCKLLYKTN